TARPRSSAPRRRWRRRSRERTPINRKAGSRGGGLPGSRLPVTSWPPQNMKRNTIGLIGFTLAAALVAAASFALEPAAVAGPLEDGVAKLASASEDDIQEGLRRLAALDDPKAIPALEALCDDRLRAGPDGKPYIFDSKTRDLRDALTGQAVSPRPS